MEIKAGDKVQNIVLPSITNEMFDTSQLKGKRYMISFLRFASCPFCNLRIHQLVYRHKEFGNDFTIVAIFDSPHDNLVRHAGKHQSPFPILADPENFYYKAFGVRKSVTGLLKGMIFRFPTLVKGMLRGYIPLTIKGSLITMPADFLIDENGRISKAYYGKDEGDHLDIDEVIQFSHL